MSEPASDATTPVPTATGAATAAASEDEAGERGTLAISFSVVRRIAEHAADTTEGTVRTERRLVGVGLGEAGATAKVSGYGDQVDLRLEVPLAYPAPIALTVDAVRGNVRERVQTLTGYAVRALDVTVSALAVPAGPAAPTRRTE
ncbi:Asp23/Gls24 family envelope stress response protein [Actinomycetospora endophytica]|uniref:Asp23/Gls24 family envelope stress response protein n=1 Tax=Actinomycetospora endophytica TaxID=2291215 RepID=A0ABS8PEY7_9PSEU|nr:Asp23/Gls24 family envelope stress response protein [Actinomycetospora endophytica]MCD2196729.1 Asp23/Gls24 family envelope stress response protein [Actinomycetospora endophytica]